MSEAVCTSAVLVTGHLSEMELCRLRNLTLTLTLILTPALPLALSLALTLTLRTSELSPL